MTVTRDLGSTAIALDALGANRVTGSPPQANIADGATGLHTRTEHLSLQPISHRARYAPPRRAYSQATTPGSVARGT